LDSGTSFSFIVGSVAAWCTNPTFVGWAGAGKSLLVGIGTSIASGISGTIGFLCGGLVGGILGGLLFRSRKGAAIGAFVLGVPCAAVTAVAGGFAGYATVESWMLNKEVTSPFNDKAGKKLMNDAKTLALDAKDFFQHKLNKTH
jgi:hypothetical protein